MLARWMKSFALPVFVTSLLLGDQARAAEGKADAAAGRRVDITVTAKGFEPARVKVKKGEPLTLAVTRTVERTCATEIVVPGYGIDQKLPLGETVTVTFTPDKAGELVYGCAMRQMIKGIITVE